MTGRGLRILLTTLCCLLAVTTSASAECAWVVWVEPMLNSWDPHSTYQTFKECDSRAVKLNDDWNQNPKRKKEALIEAICLPDTVDPRGAKR